MPTPYPANGLYDPSFEHDACGMGFVADLHGRATHKLVDLAVQGAVNLTHRGAVNADPNTGDGAGVTLQIPHALLAPDAKRLGGVTPAPGDLGVAMVFLPHDAAQRAAARAILEEAVARTQLTLLGWRAVPTDPSVLGASALESLPGIEQLLIARPDHLAAEAFGPALYLARRRAARGFREQELDAYIVSMSERTLVYKGLMVAPQLSHFYPDLRDERTVSALALFHQRFATNTLPNWKLAQPFRFIAHNGEINTLLGNRAWMNARGPDLVSDVWGETVQELLPVLEPAGSDSQSLDEALDLLVTSGRDVLHAMMMLIPEAWENMPDLDPDVRAFFAYHAGLVEPWDGPAAVAFTDGVMAAAVMDRNGLRPARYQVTRSGVVIMGSEIGLMHLEPSEVIESGRLGPGTMIAVDTVRHRLWTNDEIKTHYATQRPYRQWVQQQMRELPLLADTNGHHDEQPPEDLVQRQALFGYTTEEFEYVIKPMARNGKEPVGSMGDDTPLSALQDDQRLLYTYFRQKFAQVTNPAIDSVRERIVMSLDTFLGPRQSLLEERPEAARLLHLPRPVLLNEDLAQVAVTAAETFGLVTLEALFPAAEGPGGLRPALDALCADAERAVDNGAGLIVLSDRGADSARAPMPMLLAVASVHQHLIRSGRRMRASLIAETGDARDVHQLACLIGYGASAVNPYLALDTLRGLYAAGEFEEISLEELILRYRQALDAGVLKIMSKMGISAVSSYHGGQIFEALGLGPDVIACAFPDTVSRIGGVNIEDIGTDALSRHGHAFPNVAMPHGGWYKYRRDGDYHANEPPVWRALHKVAQNSSLEGYEQYLELVHTRPPTTLRDLLDFQSDREPIPLYQVEDIPEITRRFSTGAMSLGALSPETHEDLARAMNSLGGRSNTGEGGEDPRRYSLDGEMRDANSKVKQVASGRFGVTPSYLAAAQELEIKIAQGSKPGEGGQLPGHKVTNYIAMLRHSTPGVELISPPPHHDIYSIEDLSQLIYDLKMVNPDAKVCVKLVAAAGVGTIAAGVAKAYADVIHISGADGGTGASPLSSLKYAGAPWELGVKETHEVLVANDLRGRVTLRTDGGFHSGRDVVMAALLGAEQYGFGTAALVALGCKMARQCHLNTCPVGIATQREDLRAHYFGKPEMLVNFLLHVGQEVRRILASLGYQSLNELIGRSDLLTQVPPRSGNRAERIDLSRLLVPVDPENTKAHHCIQPRNNREDAPLEDVILKDVAQALELGTPIERHYQVRNTDRTLGARISGRIARRYGDHGLQPGTITLHFSGSAGQSFGAFLARGLRLFLTGEANDYVGKGMSGGLIAIHAAQDAGVREDAVRVGNTVLYGATGGELYVAGYAGERFAVRNSGARAVVEGVGDHGCEYMTSGRVAVIGPTGRNFAAGMTGGIAYVLDQDGTFASRCNPDHVDVETITDRRERIALHDLINSHHRYTGSATSRALLDDWDAAIARFVKIMPRDYKRVLRERRRDEFAAATNVS